VEVNPGYKQTEVGVIPEEWDVSTLGRICSFENGDRSSNYPSPGSFRLSGIPFINAGHLAEGNISANEMNYITQEAYDRLGGGKVKAGDILFCLRGSLGKFGVVTNNFGRGAIASSLVIVRPKESALNRDFLRCYFSSTLCAQMIETWSGGAAQPNLGAKELARFSIQQPPLAEQRAIATALSDVDGLLDGLNRLIAKKRDLKQAAMQQLLTGQTRLPGFSGEWEVKRLGDVLKVRHGKSQHGITKQDGKYPILASGGEIGRTNAYIYDQPSVLIGRKGTIDSPQYVDSPFWTVDTLFFTEISSEANAKFVFYKFTMIRWRSYNEASGVPSLNAKTIENIEVTMPPLPEQRAIAEALTEMDEELAGLTQRREKTCALKQAMMQELLTGRTRLI
jgi:type I restriction enzyme, S subunit